jgi:hypothetical protein
MRVTTELISCTTLDDFYACLLKNRRLASGITMAAAMTHLAKLVTASPSSWHDPSIHAKAVQGLSLSMHILIARLHELPPRGYANSVWALSKIYSINKLNTSHAPGPTQQSTSPTRRRRHETIQAEMGLSALAFKYASDLIKSFVLNKIAESSNAQVRICVAQLCNSFTATMPLAHCSRTFIAKAPNFPKPLS